MMGPNLTDEIDCGSFFNNIDDLLDFPTEDASHASASAAAPVDPPAKLWSADDSDLVFPGSTVLDLSAELSVPYEDIVQLEWLSNFVEDSFSSCGSLTMKKVEPSSNTTTKEDSTQFQTASPVSVLESSSFSSREKAPEIHIPVPCGRARSKRARPSTFNPHPILRLISPTFSVGENISKASLDCENFANFAESHPVNKLPKQPSGSRENKKKKKIKVSFPSGEELNNTQSLPVRKCLHCEITKTPQWRAGPMGPKTLCNACGVRYKSGRLFPEYRPAASPTFCASLHSNSHKKVLEMRHKIGNIIGSATDSDALPELIPNTNSSITLEEYM